MGSLFTKEETKDDTQTNYAGECSYFVQGKDTLNKFIWLNEILKNDASLPELNLEGDDNWSNEGRWKERMEIYR